MPATTHEQAQMAVKALRHALNERNWAPSGKIYQSFAQRIDTLESYISGQAARDDWRMDPATLRDGIEIAQALGRVSILAQISRLDPVGQYRVSIPWPAADDKANTGSPLVFQGTVKQLVSVIAALRPPAPAEPSVTATTNGRTANA